MFSSSSISSKTTINATSSIDEDKSTPLTKQESKIRAIQQSATNFLGRGYDYSEKELLGHAVGIPAKYVTVLPYKICDAYAIGHTFEEASTLIQRKFKWNFHLPCPIEMKKCQKDQNVEKDQNLKENIVFAVCHMDFHQCHLNQIPDPKKKEEFCTNNDLIMSGFQDHFKKLGDSFVSSGLVYTGYIIYWYITTQNLILSQQQAGESEQSSQGNILKGSIRSLSQSLQQRKIVKVKMKGEGVGGYLIPTTKFPLENLEQIQWALQTIEKDYKSRVNFVPTSASLLINEGCLADYKMISHPKSPTSAVSFPAQFVPKTGKINFSDLAIQIQDFDKDNSLSQTLEKISLQELLESMERIFPPIFRNQFESSPPDDSIGVIGYSGIGKSALIGYLNGANIVWKEIEDIPGHKMSVADYGCQRDEYLFPEIGHENSKTKGVGIYGKYIDTGGMGDTGGLSVDICNAEAINWAVKVYSPKRLIVVINSAVFLPRAQQFLEIVSRLERIVGNLTDKKVLSSILFLVNDRLQSKDARRNSKKKILKHISRALTILKRERDKLLSEYPEWIERFNQRNYQENCEIDQLRKVDPQAANFQRQIELLETIAQLDNIIVADIFKEETRKDIEEWKKRSSSEILIENMDNFVQEGHLKFKTTLLNVATFFHEMFRKKTALKENFQSLIEFRSNASKISSKLSSETSFTSKKREKLTKHYQKVIDSTVVQLERNLQQITNRQKELDALKKEEIVFWRDLHPNESFNPGFWDRVYQKKYRFEFVCVGTPIARVEKPTLQGYSEEDKSKCAEGKYQVTYTTSFVDIAATKVSDVSVKLYVKHRDHPSTKKHRASIEEELNNLISRKNELNNRLAEYKQFINKHTTEKKGEEQTKEWINKIIQQYKNSQKEIIKELNKIGLMFNDYSDFFFLVAQIIEKLNLNNSGVNSEQKLFANFLSDFGSWYENEIELRMGMGMGMNQKKFYL